MWQARRESREEGREKENERKIRDYERKESKKYKENERKKRNYDIKATVRNKRWKKTREKRFTPLNFLCKGFVLARQYFIHFTNSFLLFSLHRNNKHFLLLFPLFSFFIIFFSLIFFHTIFPYIQTKANTLFGREENIEEKLNKSKI